MKKARPDIYLSDGRIDANKAFELVHEKMMAMTPEEFRRVAEMPVVMRGTDSAIAKAGKSVSSKPKGAAHPTPEVATKKSSASQSNPKVAAASKKASPASSRAGKVVSGAAPRTSSKARNSKSG